MRRRLVMSLAAALACVPAGAQAATIEFQELPTRDSRPTGITTGPGGNLWFTENTGNRIGYITPSGTVKEFNKLDKPPAEPGERGPVAIVTGPDGNIWFTESKANRIGRITPDGVVTEFPPPPAGLTPAFTGPVGIANGPDGNIWFTEFDANRIGYINPGTGDVTELPPLPAREGDPPGGSGPSGITAGPDGHLWFTERNVNRIGRISPGGEVTEFDLPKPNSQPTQITAGPDGNLWFTELKGNRIGRITPGGEIREFPLVAVDAEPTGITVGSDGNLWFTEFAGNRVGRVTLEGVVSEFPALPAAHSGPNRIATGPDGNLWFTETNANRIARATPDVPPIVETGGVSAIAARTASVEGTVRPSNAETIYFFEYGLDDGYGEQTGGVSAGSGDAPVPVRGELGPLLPDTAYHYRLTAENGNGKSSGEDQVFATPPEPPPPPPPPPPGEQLPAPRFLTLRVSPKLEPKRPYVFKVSGILKPPSAVPVARACGQGIVTITFKRARRRIATRRAEVRLSCTYRTTVTIKRLPRAPRGSSARARRTLQVSARFQGNQALRARSARGLSVRIR